ncbi:aspartyl-phosphate phosphatase Spo0E family protein [Paenactinomyces guangxiensis]|uniref:Aspartyl-phosphate phosphatase Spo0E family protein n=2 Tax=Paenactinomyces guangxiensis TaxID=1490290 RepID=A0A7W2A7M8_9BACL|nr:aspartyl-phosphate phosphatase Spo0E family protein [Paenactinomyces guangxiensis]MBH8591033.1 aspartyl-phosphate phosphatase Spo0E family protein [Paenactinomyces guangxiensis]
MLKEKMEAVRRKMEEAAKVLGLGHPKVYQLSRELDQLHNQWEKECARRKSEKIYRIHPHASQTKERAQIKMYNVG